MMLQNSVGITTRWTGCGNLHLKSISLCSTNGVINNASIIPLMSPTLNVLQCKLIEDSAVTNRLLEKNKCMYWLHAYTGAMMLLIVRLEFHQV